jgi:hypothetical protein
MIRWIMRLVLVSKKGVDLKIGYGNGFWRGVCVCMCMGMG